MRTRIVTHGSKISIARRLGALACVLSVAVPTCLADIVLFREGRREVIGEIIRNNPSESYIWLRWRESKDSDKWTTSQIDRTRILNLRPEPGDQSDGRKDAPTAQTPRAIFRAELELTNGERLAGACVHFHPPDDLEFFVPSTTGPGSSRKIPLKSVKSLRLRAPTTENGSDASEDDIELDLLLRQSLPSRPTQPEILVLTLRGGIGEHDFLKLDDTISPESVEAMMRVALDRHPAAIVLDIDSLGGTVDAKNEIIEHLLDLQRNKNVRIVAWPSKAGSAAALISLACKEVLVRPTTRLGATTRIDGRGVAAPEPNTASERKERAWENGLDKQVDELTNRSPLVRQAMADAEMTLWFHPVQGFTDRRPWVRAGETSDWEALDEDPELPLVLTGDELLKIRFASARATESSDLPAALELPDATPIQTLDLRAEPIQRAVRRRIAERRSELDGLAAARDELRSRTVASMTKLRIAIRVFEQFLVDGDERNLQNLRSAIDIAITSLPTVTPREATSLREHAADWLRNFENQLRNAQNCLIVAREGLNKYRSGPDGSIAANGLMRELDGALEALVYAHIGPDFKPPSAPDGEPRQPAD